ncbi:transcriptional repressor [Rickettsiales bacterium]|nr:transcriptional repressor [Rickettsiales bacterium]
MSNIIKLCEEKNIRMTDQRIAIAKVLSESNDHPDTEEIYRRAYKKDKSTSIATVYRTMRIFKEAGIVAEHDFGDGKSRYEELPEEHHDHLIDIKTGKVIEFHNEEIERIQEQIAEKLGYKLVDHRLELYAVPIEKK